MSRHFIRLFTMQVILAAPLLVSSSGGAELIHNGDFEEGELTGWSLLVEGKGDGSVEQEASNPGSSFGPHTLRLTVRDPGDRCGVAQDASPGIRVESGQWYDLTFQAQTGPRENNRGYGLTVSLESREGGKVCARSTIPEVGGAWAAYQLALYAHHSAPDARLIITMSEPGTLRLDGVSLRARQPTTAR